MKKQRKILSMVMVLVMLFSLASGMQTAVAASLESDFIYDEFDGSIVRYLGTGGAVDIPATIGGVAVQMIGNGAFNNKSSITSISIPSGVTIIGIQAFQNCTNLKSVKLPDTLQTIGDRAFMSCDSLVSIVIPASVTEIADYAFCASDPYFRTDMRQAVFQGDAPTMGDGVFENVDIDFKIYYPNDKSGYTSPLWEGYPAESYAPDATYTLTYDANGGAIGLTSVNALHTGDCVIIPASDDSFVYEGYKFSGWNTSADGTGDQFSAGSVIPIGINNVVLYAQWKPIHSIDTETVAYGTISIDNSLVAQDDVFTVTLVPEDGCNYVPGTLKFKDPTTGDLIDGIVHDTNVSPTVIKYIMPACDILVTAEFAQGDFLYEVTTGDAIRITKYIGTGGSTAIPSSIDGKSVTTIGQGTIFYTTLPITGVTIPSTVTTIEEAAITLCSSLKSVYFEGNAPVIGDSNFDYVNDDFTFYYYEGSTGFTSPTWNGYPSVAVALSSGGGSSSGGGTSTVTPPVTPTVPPTTITETPSTGNTSPSVTSTTTTEAKADSNGNAVASVTESQMTDAITKAVEAAAQKGVDTQARVEIKVSAPAGTKSVETSIPKAAFTTVSDGRTDELKVSTPIAAITFGDKALSAISKEMAGDVKITASNMDTASLSEETKQTVGDRPVFNFSVTSGDKTISQFGGNVTVALPYTPKEGEDINAIIIYFITDEGKLETVSNCSYDPSTGTISFITNHFSIYAIGYNKMNFQDVGENARYRDAVSFIAARGITKGTGNGNYSPDQKLTRGEFLVMLMKAYGISPDTQVQDNFNDAGSTYYTNYLAAAKRLGISAGVGNNKYAPNKVITNQEMYALTYKALDVIGQLPQGVSGKSLSDFTDAGQVATWAKDAMTLFVETGIIGGNSGKLTPGSATIRAEMAEILYNLLSK